jgi:hypothetical protein
MHWFVENEIPPYSRRFLIHGFIPGVYKPEARVLILPDYLHRWNESISEVQSGVKVYGEWVDLLTDLKNIAARQEWDKQVSIFND